MPSDFTYCAPEGLPIETVVEPEVPRLPGLRQANPGETIRVWQGDVTLSDETHSHMAIASIDLTWRLGGPVLVAKATAEIPGEAMPDWTTGQMLHLIPTASRVPARLSLESFNGTFSLFGDGLIVDVIGTIDKIHFLDPKITLKTGVVDFYLCDFTPCFASIFYIKTFGNAREDGGQQSATFSSNRAISTWSAPPLRLSLQALHVWNLLDFMSMRALDSSAPGDPKLRAATQATLPDFDREGRLSVLASVHLDSPISGKQLNQETEMLGWFFSFMRGSWSFPVISMLESPNINGPGQAHVKVGRGPLRSSWVPRSGVHDDRISELLARFREDWLRCDNERDVLSAAIEWYIASCCAENPSSAMVLIQSGLELLSWADLVLRDGTSRDGFERMPAADKIRLSLRMRGIDNSLELGGERLRRFAVEKQAADGVAAFVTLRNRFVHPPKRANEDRPDVTLASEGVTIGLYYLELALLSRLEYRGSFRNRITGDDDAVPWAI